MPEVDSNLLVTENQYSPGGAIISVDIVSAIAEDFTNKKVAVMRLFRQAT
jgi:hypothetical protein